VAVPRRFEARYRVRFDEADAVGQLRPSGFLRFAQDIAWQHSEAAGFDRSWYAERAIHWLVRDVDLRILDPVTFGERLDMSTEVTGWRHVWARRHAEVRVATAATRGEGPLATIDTDWVLLAADGRPARLPPDVATFLASGRMFARARLDLGPVPVATASIAATVRHSDVDPMGHLNNASYLDLIDEAIHELGDAAPVHTRHYRVSYHLPALAGANVVVVCWRIDGDGIACRISDAAGTQLTSAIVTQTSS